MSSSKLNPFIREPNNEADMLLASSERMSRKSTRRFCCACCIVVLGVAVCLAVVLGVTLGIAAVVNYLPSDPYERAVALLTEFPVIDGLVFLWQHYGNFGHHVTMSGPNRKEGVITHKAGEVAALLVRGKGQVRGGGSLKGLGGHPLKVCIPK